MDQATLKIALLALLFILRVGADDDNTLVIKMDPSVDPREFSRDHGLKYVRSLDALFGRNSGYHEFRSPNSTSHRKRAEKRLRGDPAIEWFQYQEKRKQHTRVNSVTSLRDPLAIAQWHLRAQSPGLNVDGALAQGVDGTGVTIMVVDDGVERMHPDLREAMPEGLSRDFNGHGGSDPSPSDGDSHGTSAAGVACARRNNVCGVGVASGSRLSGVRLIARATSDLMEAEGIGWMRDRVDIVSCSWGPQDDGARLDAAGRLVQETFEQGVREGRSGKGTIFVWAGGNGADRHDNCNYDGYANDFRTISVSAVDSNEQAAWYSEPCAMHLMTAPSSGAAGHGVTTDTINGRCTNDFGGTSSAAPAAAGAIANLLQVNPALSWRDVQGVIAKSAVPLGYDRGDWSYNTRGFRHSHHFGFGRLDLPRSLQVARNWTAMPRMTICTTQLLEIGQPIPQKDGGTASLKYDIVVAGVHEPCIRQVDFIESVGLRVRLRHPRRGQVTIHLRDPEGVTSKLAEEHPDYHADYPPDGWLFNSVRHWGSRPQGTWSLIVYDTVADRNHGMIDSVILTIRGHKETV